MPELEGELCRTRSTGWAPLTRGWRGRVARAGLHSLATNLRLPAAFDGHRLRHLVLTETVILFDPGQLPCLTHLTFGWHLPAALPDFATAFPGLTYLAVGALQPNRPGFTVSFARAATPTLETFVTYSSITPDVCQALPGGLTSLAFAPRSGREIVAAREGWTTAAPEGTDKRGEVTLTKVNFYINGTAEE